VVLHESSLPVRPQVAGACDILGIDPLYVANEGKLVAVVPPDQAGPALAALHGHPLGREAARIGEVRADPPGVVVLAPPEGPPRVVDLLEGAPLPRIC
jgi:hydrogenase expression/formation protein HypE